MQMGFYFDQSRCIGCHTCAVACKDWNDVAAGLAHWLRITSIEEGKYPDVSLIQLFLPCNHCAKAVCADVCPVNAISKREKDGIVLVDREVCQGGDLCGRLCEERCPYKSPQFGSEENPKMQKCTFCVDRIEINKKPTCVDACPVRALDAGPIEELRQKYGSIDRVKHFADPSFTKPSIVFKPKQ